MTSDLPAEDPTSFLENSARLSAGYDRSGNRDRDGPDGQRQILLGAHFEATENRFMDIGQGLGLGSAGWRDKVFVAPIAGTLLLHLLLTAFSSVATMAGAATLWRAAGPG